MSRARRLEVPPDAAGDRLDSFLAQILDIPRSRVQAWIRDSRVSLSSGRAKPGLRLRGEEIITVDPAPPPSDPSVSPEAGEIDVLYEDEHLLVVNKPPGLVVHPGAGREGGTLVHRLLAVYPELEGLGGPGRPGIVHRLDKGTSGALLVARSHLAYQSLSLAFAERRIEKLYVALCFGTFATPRGTIDLPIGRHPEDRKRMAVRPQGRPAHTDYLVLAAESGVSLVVLGLGTGRTHQIRVHLKSLGHPLVGDPVYGEDRWKGLPRRVQGALRSFERPALHAWRLGLVHPVSAARQRFEAPPPRDVDELWQELGGSPLRDALPDQVDVKS